ncbi:MAG TPA: SIMPL domain-containing protein [Burkholderiales bacterium]|nr:SIMPL domain-containing protein [Burkholderiales bacterium]
MKKANRILPGLILACLLVAENAVRAEEPPRYNEVDLQAEAQREIQNDVMAVTLYAEQNGENPAQVANAVNKIVNSALRTAAEVKGVKAVTGGYQTYAIYGKNNRLESWRVRSEIRLESKDFGAASNLIGKLQSSMQLSYLGFTVSPEARRQAENEMIAEAIAKFRSRADIVKQSINGRSYKIRRISVNTSGFHPRPVLARALAAQEVAAPNVEGGVSQVTVNVNGMIEVE